MSNLTLTLTSINLSTHVSTYDKLTEILCALTAFHRLPPAPSLPHSAPGRGGSQAAHAGRAAQVQVDGDLYRQRMRSDEEGALGQSVWAVWWIHLILQHSLSDQRVQMKHDDEIK